MKSFLQFLTETSASQQATRLGLKGDGHGGWYDNEGEFIAKTEKGTLKFYNKRQVVGGKDPKQSEQEKNYSSPNTQVPPEGQQAPAPEQQVQPTPEEIAAQEEQAAAEQQQADIQSQLQSPDLQAGPPPVPKTRGTLTLAFGRFNPPHAGHGQLMDIAAESAAETEGDYIIVPSRTNDPNNRTIFDVLKKAHNDGYTNVKIVGGSDRQKQFDKLSKDYNGSLYQFDNLETISSGDRDDDAEGIEGFSASKMRLAAIEGDFKSFYNQLHKQVKGKSKPLLNKKDANNYFRSVRKTMGVEEVKECWNTWEIAPKEDPENLREAYISKEIFDIGTKVEDVTTGLIGRIIRRGANHLICVTEDEMMFKSWIKDVSEAVVNSTNISGVPASQRLVGTDAHFKYVASLTPGSTWNKQFINKYRKSKN